MRKKLNNKSMKEVRRGEAYTEGRARMQLNNGLKRKVKRNMWWT